jgi:hypothetical protein
MDAPPSGCIKPQGLYAALNVDMPADAIRLEFAQFGIQFI